MAKHWLKSHEYIYNDFHLGSCHGLDMYTLYLTQIECVDIRTQAQYNLTSRVKGDRAVRPKREAWDICGRFQVIKVTSLGMRVVLNCDTMTNKWWELCTFLQIYVYIVYINIVPNIGKYLNGSTFAIWGTGNLIGEVICHRNWYLSLFYTTAIWGQEILHLKVCKFATKFSPDKTVCKFLQCV